MNLKVTLFIVISFLTFQTISAQSVLFSPDTLYLGKIPIGSSSTRIVEIKNTSPTALNITKIEIVDIVGGNFAILNNPGTVSLAQLQNLVLEIQFTPVSNDTIKASLAITSNAGTSPDVVLLFGLGSSGSPITFERLFGDEEKDGLSSIQETPDGGYICAGTMLPPDDDFTNFLVAKTDQYGLVEWFKNYGDDEIEEANTVVQADNGNYVVFGRTNSNGAGGFDYYLMEINSTGDVVWDKTYGGDRDEQARSMVKTPDGGYLLVGNTRSFGSPLSTDVYVIKISADGSIVWEETYGGAGGESPSNVIRTNDDNYVIVGNTGSMGAGSFDAYFLKIDGNGNKIWEKTFGGTEDEDGADITELNDGSLAAVGYTVSYGKGGRDIFLLKLDSSGNEVWHKTFGGIYQDYAANIVSGVDNIIFTGVISETLQEERTSIFKTDLNGNLVQQFKSRPGEINMSSGDLIINNAGNLILAGSSGSFSNSIDAYILNTFDFRSVSSVDDNDIILDDFVLYQNYPNPFNNQTQISFSLDKPEYVELCIFNIAGQKVKTLLHSYKNAGYYNIGFNGDGLSSGAYFIKMTTNTSSKVRSMILLK